MDVIYHNCPIVTAGGFITHDHPGYPIGQVLELANTLPHERYIVVDVEHMKPWSRMRIRPYVVPTRPYTWWRVIWQLLRGRKSDA